MNKRFTFEISSDLDYEGMVIEISFDNVTIARLNYDKGINEIEIEFVLYTEIYNKFIFPLNDFLLAIEKAKNLAIKCAKEDEERGS